MKYVIISLNVNRVVIKLKYVIIRSVTHVFKYFPQIIAGYDDGKDEAEKKELLEELELEEADLKENEDKRAQAKAVQNSKKEKH